MEIDILIETPAWQVCDIEDVTARAADGICAELGLDPARFAVSVLACDDTRIATLNSDFRGKPTPTNVLSWPAEEIDLPLGQMPQLPTPAADGPPHELGDIAVAYETCAREAEEQGKDFDDHLTHLMVHSILHLLGFDHINDPDATVMESLETRILARLGVSDPY